MKRTLIIFAVLASLLLARSAEAKNCNWNTVPGNIVFPTYLPLTSPNITATSGYVVRCTPNTNGTVALTAGSAPASYAPRTMKGPGGATIRYNLFHESTHNSVWGDGSGLTSVSAPPYVAGPGETRIFPDTIFARVEPNQDVPPGTYTDTVRADLSDGAGTADSQSFTISVTVIRECTVETFSLSFGNYDSFAATDLDTSAPVVVKCSNGTLANVSLDSGLYASGGFRRMRAAGGFFLNYDIYRESTYSSLWNTVTRKSGTSTGATNALPLTPGGPTMYGRVFAGQQVPAGAYYDTVQAIVNY